MYARAAELGKHMHSDCCMNGGLHYFDFLFLQYMGDEEKLQYPNGENT
jgi:hypothetical protein